MAFPVMAIPAAISAIASLYSAYNSNKGNQGQQPMNMGSGLSTMFGGMQGGVPQGAQMLPRYTPQQQSFLDAIFPLVQQGIAGDKFDFGPIADEARHKFNTQTIPGLAEQYTAGLRNTDFGSSGFARALASGAGDFERGLAAQRQGFNFQRQQMLSGLLPSLLGQSYDWHIPQQQPSFLSSLGAGIGGALPMAAGQFASSYFGNSQQPKPTMGVQP